jgi:hypothetical protein
MKIALPPIILRSNGLREKYVLVPADKACRNYKTHHYQCITNKLGINSTICNRAYTPNAFSKDEILQNQASVLNTFDIPDHVVDDYELPYLYWIPKLHETPYKVILLVQKNDQQTSVNIPYKYISCCEGEVSDMLCDCIFQSP